MDDPQRRIAELERQLAEAKAAAGPEQRVEQDAPVSATQLGAIDEQARRLAQALQAERGNPFAPGLTPAREALSRAVVDAGLSQQQYRDVLARAGLRAGGTIKLGSQVVFSRCDPSDPVFLEPGVRAAYAAPSRKRRGAGWIGPVIAMLGGVIGLCVGGAAAVTAVIPSTALWMSPIVCRGGYEMAYNASHYSYKPGQSGTSVSFQCVGDGDYYDVNDFAVFVLQSLLFAVVLCVALAVGRVLWLRSHKPGRPAV
jgi:hypothetical protein